MEHDSERIIREKIRATELEPITWNKEIVWSAIDKRSAHQSNRIVFYYYAAASILLAGTLLFYAVKVTERKEFDIQKRSGQVTFEKKQKDIHTPISKKTEEKSALALQFTKKASFRKTISKKINGEKSLASFYTTSDKETDSLTSLTIQENIEVPMSMSDTTERTVDPIIGIYISKKKNEVARKENRMRVRFFSPHEKSVVPIEQSSPLILARINENLK